MTEACARLGSDSRRGCQTEELRSSLREKSLAKTQVIFYLCFALESSPQSPIQAVTLSEKGVVCAMIFLCKKKSLWSRSFCSRIALAMSSRNRNLLAG
jgi:hypothetical protein